MGHTSKNLHFTGQYTVGYWYFNTQYTLYGLTYKTTSNKTAQPQSPTLTNESVITFGKDLLTNTDVKKKPFKSGIKHGCAKG